MQWVNYCLERCCWNFWLPCIIIHPGSESTIVSQSVVDISDHTTWHFIQEVSQPLSCKVLLNLWPSCMTFYPVGELTIISQGVVEFLIIFHDILSSWWVDLCLARCCWSCDHLTWHSIQLVSQASSCKMFLNFWPLTWYLFSLWVDCCLTMCCWISDHVIWHFIQWVSQPWSLPVLLNLWPSHMIFCPVCESTIILQGVIEFLIISHDICPVSESTVVLQGVIEFLTIWHHILSSLWVDCHFARYCWISAHLAWHLSSLWVDHYLARCCWIFDYLASHFIQFVSCPSSCEVMLNFWLSCIKFHPGSESTIVSQGVVQFLTTSCDISSSWWVNCYLVRCCWISDPLTWHFVQRVSRLLSWMLLNFWPSHITFCTVCESTIVLQCIVEFLTISHHNSSRK